MPDNPTRRTAWAAAATLGYVGGNTLVTIFTLSYSKAEAITTAIMEAVRNLPPNVGDNYGVINSHATPIAPEVVCAAAEELSTKAGTNN